MYLTVKKKQYFFIYVNVTNTFLRGIACENI